MLMESQFQFAAVGEVDNVEYRAIMQEAAEGVMQQEQDVLYVTFERLDGENDGFFNINNGAFHVKNPSLAFLAYCGARPSRLDKAVGTRVPLGQTEYGLFPIDVVFEQGRNILKTRPWCPQLGRDEEEA